MKNALFDQKKNAETEEFFAQYLRTNSKAYIIVLTTVLLFECIMIVRGVILFDFAKLRYKMYFIAYVFLALATVAGLICIRRNRDEKMSANGITLALHLYSTAIIAWSVLVSYFDMSVGNPPLVYLTVIMALGGLSVIFPLYYAVNLFISALLLFCLGMSHDLAFLRINGSGKYLNIAVFLLVSLLMAFRQYRVSRRDTELTAHLAALSYHDQLTGIFNRRMYDSECTRIEESDAEVMVGVMDLDCFKRLNDTFGHDFGDDCLVETARRLQENFGERTYRIGGDEFTVLFAPLERSEIEEKVAAVNSALDAAFPGKNAAISAGFFLRAQGSGLLMDDADDRADEALYRAKASGKRKVCFAQPDPEGETP